MKTIKIKAITILLLIIGALSFSSCKKGEDDPGVSFRSREQRFANTWTLTKFEKNGQRQDLNGATYIYKTTKDGGVTETIEGAVFGFSIRSVRTGVWEFVSNKEDVRITIDSNVDIFKIQRLANSELWLKQINGSDVNIYYFEGE
jgi:hypothetical protein